MVAVTPDMLALTPPMFRYTRALMQYGYGSAYFDPDYDRVL